MDAAKDFGWPGIAFQATDLTTEAWVIVRFPFRARGATRSPERKEFSQNQQKVAGLEHFNVSWPFSWGVFRQQIFLVHGFDQGIPLTEELKLAPLGMDRVLHIGGEICEGLAYLHQHGLSHGEIRAENVWLLPTRDYPITRLIGPAWWTKITPASTASDLRGVGQILFGLTTGRTWGPEKDTSPRKLNSRVPESLDRLVVDLLSGDPKRMPTDIRVVAQRLRDVGPVPLPPR